MDGLHGTEGTKERFRELKDKTIEITQSEQQRKNRLKKMNRIQGPTYGTVTEDLTFVWSESHEEEENLRQS